MLQKLKNYTSGWIYALLVFQAANIVTYSPAAVVSTYSSVAKSCHTKPVVQWCQFSMSAIQQRTQREPTPQALLLYVLTIIFCIYLL